MPPIVELATGRESPRGRSGSAGATSTFAGVTRGTLVLGLVLLPFSTAAGGGSAVVAYGFPALAVTAGLYAGYRTARPAASRAHLPAYVAAAALVGALTISTVVSPTPVESVARLVPNMVGAVLFLYVLSPLYDAGAAPRSAYADLTSLLVLCGAILGAYFTIHFATAVAANGLPAVLLDRITGGLSSLPWGASNVVASHVILPLLLTFAPTDARASRTARGAAAHRFSGRGLALIARVAMLAAVVVSQSRAALVAVMLGVTCLGLVLRGRERRDVISFLAAAAVALAIAALASDGALAEQLSSAASTRLGGEDVGDLNGRTEIWGTFFTAFARSPVVGIGYYASPHELGSTGHDVLLTTLAERGVVGLVLSSGVLVAAVAAFVRAWRLTTDAAFRNALACLAVGGACACFHLLFEDANFTQPYMILSWLALALPELALRRARALAALGDGDVAGMSRVYELG